MSTLIIISLPHSLSSATAVYDYAVTGDLKPSSATSVYDFAVTGDGSALDDHSSAPATLLPAAARGSEIVAIVPADFISWHRVDLPKGVSASSPRLRSILEGLLEDRLLDEADKLHFAIGPATEADGRTWVAVCERQWLRGHMQALEAAQRPVSRLVPEFAPDAGRLQLYALDDDRSPQLIATGEAASGVMRLPLTASAMELLPAGVLESSKPGEQVAVFSEPGVAALAEQVLGRKVTLLTRPQHWLDAVRSRWDLAQFDLTSSSRARTVKRMRGVGREFMQAPAWRPARWGAALVVAANLIGLNAWAWKENSALQGTRSAMRTTLTQTFPQVRVVVDPPLQMEREVAALRQATGAASPRDLESILATLGSALPPGRVPAGIEYVSGEARIKGLQLSAQESSSLTGQLQGQGYAAKLDGDNAVIRQTVGP